MSDQEKVLTTLFKQGDILASGCFVQSDFDMMLFQSPPMTPLDLLLINKVGMVSPQKLSLLALLGPSVPEGKYTLPKVMSPMLKMIILESKLCPQIFYSQLVLI